MRLTYISVGVTPESKPDFGGVEAFAEFVCEEYLQKLKALSEVGHCVTKNIHRIAIEVRNDPPVPWAGLGVFVFSVKGEKLCDSSRQPSKLRISEAIRDALLCCAADQGIDTSKILAAFKAIDQSKMFFDGTLATKTKGGRKGYPKISTIVRLTRGAAYIVAVLRNHQETRYFLVSKALAGRVFWGAKLGHFVWRSVDRFCLIDRNHNEVACKDVSEGVLDLESLFSSAPNQAGSVH